MEARRAAKEDIEKEASKVLPYLKGEKKYTAFLDCQRHFIHYGWSVAKAYSKTNEADTIRKEATTFFNNLNTKAFNVAIADVQDMDCILRKDDQGRIIQSMVFATMYIASRIICYLELFGVCKDHQRKNLGTQAVYLLSDSLYSFMGSKTTPIIYGIYITAPMSRVTKPHVFYRKIGFKEGLPFGFTPWLALNNDMMHLSVEPTDKSVAVFRDTDLISKVKKDLDVKIFPKKQMRNAAGNAIHLEEKVDAKVLERSQFNEPSFEQKDSPALKSFPTMSDTLLSALVDESQSSYSIINHKIAKSGLAIDKHCDFAGCGKHISGRHWAAHKAVHKLEEVPFSYCTGIGCIKCGQAQIKDRKHGKHQCIQCSMCGETKRGDTVKGGVCKPCSSGQKKRDIKKIKKQQKSAPEMIKTSASQVCNSALSQLVGTKRPHSFNLLDGGLEEIKDVDGNDISPSPKRANSVARFAVPQDIPELQVEVQQHQQKTFIKYDEIMVETEQQQTIEVYQPAVAKESIIEKLVLLAHTDKEAINKLKAIAASNESVQFCSAILQEVCHMFTQEYVCSFLATQSEQKKLLDCIIKVLGRGRQLNDEQVIGLLAASFAIGGAAWASSVKLLNDMTDQRRTQILNQFGVYLGKNNKQLVIEWCKEYWRSIEQQHLDLIKYLREHPTSEDYGVLVLSLAVTIQSNEKFLTFTSALIRGSESAAALTVDAIAKYPQQKKISFDEFVALVDILQNESNADAIQSIQDELLALKINRWAAIIEEAQKVQFVADSESIQSFLDQLVQAYGQVKYNKDLTLTEDERFSMFLQLAENIPNNMQFAFAQYCVALLASTPRQLWNVPAGQGKGRIEHAVAILALFLGVVLKVHMAYNCQELMERDKQEFQSYLMFLQDASAIEYHIGIEEWEPCEGELVVIDEADAIIFKDPTSFRAFIAKSACLCFTATPDDQGKGADQKVISALQIKQFHYYLDKQQQKVDLVFDETSKVATAQEKAAVIKEQSAFGPVLVYCGDDLLKELKDFGLPLLVVDRQVDHAALRSLDQLAEANQYRVVAATDLFAMRGLDYRSKNARMYFVLAKSFTNWRDACQGYNRVGRFGDACSRIQFADIPLIDTKEELKYKAQSFKFVLSMQKTKVEMKPVKVKEVTPPVSKESKGKFPYKSSKLNQKRINSLVQAAGTPAFVQTNIGETWKMNENYNQLKA